MILRFMLINTLPNNQDANSLLYNLGHQFEKHSTLTQVAQLARGMDINRMVLIPARKHTPNVISSRRFCWIISANPLQRLVCWFGLISPTYMFDAAAFSRFAYALLPAPSKIEEREESLPKSSEALWRCTVRRDRI